jgi:phosphopantothenoylcysteine decarboxylase / phosphopantothenate---cysteine ligase
VRILVTAGPTREPLDAVRFLTNAATGRMGIEVARAVAAAGHDAVLVLGPTHLVPPDDARVRTVPVVTARDMLAACVAEWPGCDGLVATAAVSDYRFAAPVAGKPEKHAGPVSVALEPNEDVLATLAATKGARRVVGFALQVEDAERRAREKYVRKGCDLVVLDTPAAIGADRADFAFVGTEGVIRRFADASKADVARAIVRFLETGSAA